MPLSTNVRDNTLELIALSKHYSADSIAVDSIDLKVPTNHYCCLLGPSGCGKTSTLRMVAGHEVVTSGVVMQEYLGERFDGCDAVVVGSEAMVRHVRLAGLRVIADEKRVPSADVVVLAGYPEVSYTDLTWAVRAAYAGATVVATGRDRIVPSDDGVIPGTGGIVAYVEYCSGAEAVAVGKPGPDAWRIAQERLGVDGPVLAVGDRLDSDIGGAAAAGIDGALVLTGVSTSEMADAWDGPAPVGVADDLSALLLA